MVLMRRICDFYQSGEPCRSLGMVASGGELSRIMLAIKTVLADSDEIPTLIFDEIDTGISGRTAQKVSEKLAIISRTHQVICITHLPQIAAMADCHFEIAKSTEGGKTKTEIRRLREEETVKELARTAWRCGDYRGCSPKCQRDEGAGQSDQACAEKEGKKAEMEEQRRLPIKNSVKMNG